MLSTLVMLAVASASIAPGTYHYTASVAGANAGSSTVTVSSGAAGSRITETGSGSLNGMAGTANVTVDLDGALAPQMYRGTYQAGGQGGTANVTIAGNTASLSTPGNGAAQSFGLESGSSHFVVVDPLVMSGFFALPAQVAAWGSVPLTAVIPIYHAATTIVPAAAAPADRPASVPAGDAGLTFSGASPFTIWYDPATYVPDLVVIPSQGVTVTRQR
jgi:hypothetical protein